MSPHNGMFIVKTYKHPKITMCKQKYYRNSMHSCSPDPDLPVKTTCSSSDIFFIRYVLSTKILLAKRLQLCFSYKEFFFVWFSQDFFFFFSWPLLGTPGTRYNSVVHRWIAMAAAVCPGVLIASFFSFTTVLRTCYPGYDKKFTKLISSK